MPAINRDLAAYIRRFGPVLCLATVAAAQFLTADRAGNFWWFDSPSHALNGAFLYDYLKSGQIGAPLNFALRYFDQLPGITIGFYPPGFALWLIPFYALLGVHHAAAQCAVSAASFGLALGTRALARHCGLSAAPSLAAGILSISFPEILIWSRQIQPEILAYMFAVWSAVWLMRWLDNRQPRALVVSAILLISALYVKQTVVFMVVPMALTALHARGLGLLRDKTILQVCAFAAVLMVPLIGLTIALGGMNVDQVRASPGHTSAFYYLLLLPQQMGLLPFVLALCGAALLGRGMLSQRGALLCVFWAGSGLLFFSMIALKQARFSTAVLPPLAILAASPMALLPPGWLRAPFVTAATLVFAAAQLGLTPAPRYCGVGPVAARAAREAPPDSGIFLLAQRSAQFIFAVRAETQRPDLRIIRAEKLYTTYRVGADWGLHDDNAGIARISHDLAANNVSVVVIERGFWSDVGSARTLNRLVNGPGFTHLGAYPVVDTVNPNKNTVMDVYRVDDYKHQTLPDIDINLPMIGRHYHVSRGSGAGA